MHATDAPNLDAYLDDTGPSPGPVLDTVWLTNFPTTNPDKLPLGPTGRRFRDVRAGDCYVGHHAAMTFGMISERLPRGMPWTSLPIVATPRLGRASQSQARNLVCICHENIVVDYPMTPLAALGQAKRLIVDMTVDGMHDETEARLMARQGLATAVSACDELAPNVTSIGFDHGEGNFAWHSTAAVAEMVRGALGLQRFRYAYRLNFRAIAARALSVAIHDLDETDVIASYRSCFSRDLVKKRDRSTSNAFIETEHVSLQRYFVRTGDMRGMDHPLRLQMLFRLARNGGVPARASLPDESMHVCLLSVFDRATESALGWGGNGKHPTRWYPNKQVSATAHMLGALGLVQIKDGMLVLTRAGERLLELLHPDMEDPDVLCRWVDPVLANEDIDERVDAWIMRTFRKCKTRVNALPAT